jgi:hypothetical protein
MEEPKFVRLFDTLFREAFNSQYPKIIIPARITKFYSNAAKQILKNFEIDKILERTSKENRDFARIIVRRDEIGRLLERCRRWLVSLP